MKKILLSLAILIASYCAVCAQNKVAYQGEINIGGGVGMGNFKMGRMHFETIHGIRLNPHFFTGVGIGAGFYDDQLGALIVPVFGHIKGYLTKSKIRPYVYTNLGYGFFYKEGFYGAGGLGLDFKISPKSGIYINLGYQSQAIAKTHRASNPYDATYGVSNMGALLLQGGCRF